MNHLLQCNIVNIPPQRILLKLSNKDYQLLNIQENEKEYLVKLVNTFNVDGKELCSKLDIPYRTFQSWKSSLNKDYRSMDPLKLLQTIPHQQIVQNSEKESFTPSSSTCPPNPTEKKIIVRRKLFGERALSSQLKIINKLRSDYNEFLASHRFSKEFGDFHLLINELEAKFAGDETQPLSSIFKTFSYSIKTALELKNTELVIQLLSLLSSIFQRKELNNLLTGINISRRLYTLANRHAKNYLPGFPPQLRHPRCHLRFTIADINNSIKFLFQSNIYRSKAFGTHIVRDSKGVKHSLPNYIRNFTFKEVWEKYKNHFSPVPSISLSASISSSSTSSSSSNSVNGNRISRRLLYKLMSLIGKSKKVAITATDTSAMKNGTLNFKRLKSFMMVILSLNPIKKKEIIDSINSLELYLKYDYKNHQSEENQCICGSFKYIFGEETINSTSGICDNCRKIMTLMLDCKSAIENIPQQLLSSLQPNTKGDLRLVAFRYS